MKEHRNNIIEVIDNINEKLIQIKWLDSGKQIGNTSISNNICIQIAIQKFNNMYRCYYFKWDMQYQYDGEEENEECKDFNTIEEAISFIESKNIMFNLLTPQKGNKIFNPNLY